MSNFFNNPNICKNEQFSNAELLDAIRKDIMGEFEAIIQYEEHIRNTDNAIAKKIWTDISNEERAHVGELFTLLVQLSPDEAIYFAEGEQEVKELLKTTNNQN